MVERCGGYILEEIHLKGSFMYFSPRNVALSLEGKGTVEVTSNLDVSSNEEVKNNIEHLSDDETEGWITR